MTIKLTELETKVLGAFNTYDDLASTIGDLGVSWTDAKELSVETGIAMKSIKGVIGSLVKKGLVDVDDDGPINAHDLKKAPTAICLTAEGAKVFFDLCAAESDAAEEPTADPAPAELPLDWGTDPAIDDPAPAQDETPEADLSDVGTKLADAMAAEANAKLFTSLYEDAGGHQPRQHCKALLAVAMAWKGSRKEYLEGAVAMGLKPNTAGAWWQVARKGS